ncbi:hypothetical protein MCUN1_000382 [Malassezia cuniculi]|uniref:Uncharacterized protein n=1 Tax=Malassezia cuniculi TaxID=948313 RepID=A0AAF0J5N1_9BASI|nr:hypothetical protein MCUN1_000382 [Malassezia cuniculi]
MTDVQLASQAHFVDTPAQPGPVSLDSLADASAESQEVENLGEHAPVAAVRKPSQLRLFSPASTRINNHGASMSHFVVIVPPPDLPVESIKSRNASSLGNMQASHVRRGMLLPLYPTLGGQLYAVAREFGLPSVGGLSLYLCDDGTGASGPRIGDATWSALYSGFFEEPADDIIDDSHETENRSAPLPYSRMRNPNGFGANASANNISRSTIPRVASISSLSNQSSSSAASFLLETGRMPIVGRFEWAVDTRRAKWWRSYVGEDEEEDEAPKNVPETRRASMPRPLRLNTRSSTRDDTNDSESRSFAPSTAPTGTSNEYDNANETQPEVAVVPPPKRVSREAPVEGDAEHEFDQPAAQPQTEPFVTAPVEPGPEDVPPSTIPSVHDSPQAAREAEKNEIKAKQHLSGSLASLSAAASRFFGGGNDHKRSASASSRPAALTVPTHIDPSIDGDKLHTPNESHIPVEALRERLSATEHHDRTSRRHMQRASVEVPGSVRNASARISAVISADDLSKPSSPTHENLSRPVSSVPARSSSGSNMNVSEGYEPLGGGSDAHEEQAQEPLWRKLAGIPPRSNRVLRHKSAASDLTGQHSNIFSDEPPSPPPELPQRPQTASAVRRGHMSRPSLRSPIVLGNSLPDVENESSDVAAAELARIRSITRKQSSHLSRAHDLIDTKIDSDTLKRQSSLEFDNTLGDLQRALELLSPNQPSRARSNPRTEQSPKPRWFFRTRIGEDGQDEADNADSASSAAVPMDPEHVFAEGHGPGAVDRSLDGVDLSHSQFDIPHYPEPENTTVVQHSEQSLLGGVEPPQRDSVAVHEETKGKAPEGLENVIADQKSLMDIPTRDVPVTEIRGGSEVKDLQNQLEGDNADNATPLFGQAAEPSRISRGSDLLNSRPTSGAQLSEVSDNTPAYVNMGIADISSTSSFKDDGDGIPGPYPQSGGTAPPVGASWSVFSNRFSQDQWSQDSRHVSLSSGAIDGTPRAEKLAQQTPPPPLPPKDPQSQPWPTSDHPWPANSRMSTAASGAWSDDIHNANALSQDAAKNPLPTGQFNYDDVQNKSALPGQETRAQDPFAAFEIQQPPSQFSPDVPAAPLPTRTLVAPAQDTDDFSPASQYDEQFGQQAKQGSQPEAQPPLGQQGGEKQPESNFGKPIAQQPFGQQPFGQPFGQPIRDDAQLGRAPESARQSMEPPKRLDSMLDALNAQAAKDVAPENDWAPWTNDRASMSSNALPRANNAGIGAGVGAGVGAAAAAPFVPFSVNSMPENDANSDAAAAGLPSAGLSAKSQSAGSAQGHSTIGAVALPGAAASSVALPSAGVHPKESLEPEASPRFDLPTTPRPDDISTDMVDDAPKSSMSPISPQLPRMGSMPDLKGRDRGSDKHPSSPTSGPRAFLSKMSPRFKWTVGRRKKGQSAEDQKAEDLQNLAESEISSMPRQSVGKGSRPPRPPRDELRSEQDSPRGWGVSAPFNNANMSSASLPLRRSDIPEDAFDGSRRGISFFNNRAHNSASSDQFGSATNSLRSPMLGSNEQLQPDSARISMPDNEAVPGMPPQNEGLGLGGTGSDMPPGFVQAHPRDSFMRGIGLSVQDNGSSNASNSAPLIPPRFPSEAWNTSMPRAPADVHVPEGQPRFSPSSLSPKFASDAFSQGGTQPYVHAGTFARHSPV